MICRNKFHFLPLLLVLLFCIYPQSIAFGGGYSPYEKAGFDLSALNSEKLRAEGDSNFVKGFESSTEADQKKYYQLALQKYFLLSKVEPYNYYPYVQMARILDEQGKDVLSKKHFFQAMNLDKYNPYTNFYFGEFHVKRKMYEKGLKYYLIAYNNGYKDNYVTNQKIAELYEKLGDLKKSEELYIKLNKINPSDDLVKSKVNSFNLSDYEKSGYYHTIRE